MPALIRKARQVLGDAALRRWLVGRALARNPAPPSFTAHRPPYLDGLLPLAPEAPVARFPPLPEAAPRRPIDLILAGETTAAGDDLFERDFADIETLLSVHRFAWLPLADANDPDTAAWLTVLWNRWRETFATPDDGWAWHPYTAAERAINLLDFAAKRGLPVPVDETLDLLAAHAPAIAERLEYFGDHHTSNHLSNNGRGLYRIGVALGLPEATAMGARILTHEATRLFAPSGVLREGSSHYHALLVAQYRSCRDATPERAKAAAFDEVVRRGLSVLKTMTLPGGLPLIGDISPDLSPERLLAALADDLESAEPCPPEELAADGWLRGEFGPWAGLWHADANGFSPMPGHGHQDCGGFELHYGNLPVFVDSGRGSYNKAGEADPDVRAPAHNSLTIDGKDPFPPNKPYYDDAFRRRIGGPAPLLDAKPGRVKLRHDGFGRLKGVGTHIRRWRFDTNRLTLSDIVEGAGTHRLARRLHTPLSVVGDDGAAILRGPGITLRVRADSPVTIREGRRWTAYGTAEPTTIIEISQRVRLPWSGAMQIEVL